MKLDGSVIVSVLGASVFRVEKFAKPLGPLWVWEAETSTFS